MQGKTYRVVFIDWYGTLSVSNFWGHFQDPSHEHHSLFAKLEKTLFSDNRHLLTPWMRGQLTCEQVIETISSQTGLDYGMLFEEFVTSCREMRLVSDSVPELVATLRDKGVRVVIATDNMDSFPRWTIPALKLDERFDGVLDSFRLRALKDDRGANGESPFFGRYLRELGVSPRQAVLVDDSRTTQVTARMLGMEYVRVERGVGLVPVLRELAKQIGGGAGN